MDENKIRKLLRRATGAAISTEGADGPGQGFQLKPITLPYLQFLERKPWEDELDSYLASKAVPEEAAPCAPVRREPAIYSQLRSVQAKRRLI